METLPREWPYVIVPNEAISRRSAILSILLVPFAPESVTLLKSSPHQIGTIIIARAESESTRSRGCEFCRASRSALQLHVCGGGIRTLVILRSLYLSMDFRASWLARRKELVDQARCLKNAWLSLKCIAFPNIHSSGKLSQCWYPGLIIQRNSAVLCNHSLSMKMKCVPLDSGWRVPL